MRRLIITALVPLALLAGCTPAPSASNAQPSASAGGSVLERMGIAQADAVTIIDSLDASPDKRPLADLKASVKADRLVLTDQAGERSLPLPADKFYLSIAPYVERTHECFAHSLSGCQGEQAGKKVHFTITDEAGTTLVDREVTTWANGFAGFWLPRDTKGTITATVDGKSGTVDFATNSDSPTCLTTLQMK